MEWNLPPMAWHGWPKGRCVCLLQKRRKGDNWNIKYCFVFKILPLWVWVYESTYHQYMFRSLWYKVKVSWWDCTWYDIPLIPPFQKCCEGYDTPHRKKQSLVKAKKQNFHHIQFLWVVLARDEVWSLLVWVCEEEMRRIAKKTEKGNSFRSETSCRMKEKMNTVNHINSNIFVMQNNSFK